MGNDQYYGIGVISWSQRMKERLQAIKKASWFWIVGYTAIVLLCLSMYVFIGIGIYCIINHQ